MRQHNTIEQASRKERAGKARYFSGCLYREIVKTHRGKARPGYAVSSDL